MKSIVASVLTAGVICGSLVTPALADSVGGRGKASGNAVRYLDFLLDQPGSSACETAENQRGLGEVSHSDLVAPILIDAGVKSMDPTVGRSRNMNSGGKGLLDAWTQRPALLKESAPPAWVKVSPAPEPGKAFVAGRPADGPGARPNPPGHAYGLGRPDGGNSFVAVPLPMAAWGGLVLFGALGLNHCLRSRSAAQAPPLC